MDCKKKKKSMEECPILIFLLFQKAIRSELDRLNSQVISFATAGGGDFRSLAKRFRFLFSIYKHHCNAEDEVIFPALDKRVKNVAGTYSLEHRGERALFSQLFELLSSGAQNDDNFRRELASRSGAIQTSLSQHMSKEEKQLSYILLEPELSCEGFFFNLGLLHSLEAWRSHGEDCLYSLQSARLYWVSGGLFADKPMCNLALLLLYNCAGIQFTFTLNGIPMNMQKLDFRWDSNPHT